MNKSASANLAASVKQRLLNYAQQNHLDFNALVTRFTVERLLYRLSVSSHAGDFYLKGAMLFVLWESHSHRPTKDLDLLFVPQYDREMLRIIFQQVVGIAVADDGLTFDSESITVEDIREENAYGGLRVKLTAYIGKGRVPLQIDVGHGDSIYPATDWADFPTLLEFSPPRIRAYPTETVVAEKLQAMIDLGLRNSRMKDYYDIHYLQRRFRYSGQDLHEAIRQTFQRRRTDLPETLPVGLSREFSENPQKQRQWEAFLRKNGLAKIGNLPEVVAQITAFVMPVFTDSEIAEKYWIPAMGWSSGCLLRT